MAAKVTPNFMNIRSIVAHTNTFTHTKLVNVETPHEKSPPPQVYI